MNTITTEIEALEKDITAVLVQGSIKGAMKETGSKSRDLWQVAPESLRLIEGFNVRVQGKSYHDYVRELADSMKNPDIGFDQSKPLSGIVVNEGGENIIYIYDGHRRLEGAKLAIAEGANIQHVPVVIGNGLSMEDLTVSLVRSNNGKELSPYETAIVCKRLVRFGWDNQEIATKLQLTTQYVENLMVLMSAPLEVREMVASDRISATTAITALKKHGANVLTVLRQATEEATQNGKTKVTAKHMTPTPVKVFQKAMRKEAPAMFDTLAKVTIDPGFSALSQEIQELVSNMITQLQEKKKAAAVTA